VKDATVQHDIVPNQHVISDNGRKTIFDAGHWAVAMHDTAVLNVGSGANHNTIHFSTDDTIVPDAGLGSDGNITDNTTARRNECAVVNLRGLAIDSDDADVGTVIDHRIFHSERCGKTDE